MQSRIVHRKQTPLPNRLWSQAGLGVVLPAQTRRSPPLEEAGLGLLPTQSVLDTKLDHVKVKIIPENQDLGYLLVL